MSRFDRPIPVSSADCLFRSHNECAAPVKTESVPFIFSTTCAKTLVDVSLGFRLYDLTLPFLSASM